MKRVILLFLAVALLSAVAVAQPGSGKGGGERGWRQGRPGMPHEPDAETRELLEQVMIARMSQALELDDEQTVVMVRRYMDHRDHKRKLFRKRQKLMQALREATEAKNDDSALTERLEALMACDKEIANAQAELFASVAQGLNPWQRAKLYVFMSEFEHDMRRLLMRAQQRRHGQWNGGPRTGGPGRPHPRGRQASPPDGPPPPPSPEE